MSAPEQKTGKKGEPIPPRYFDRDLNWLAFNERVLEEVEDPGNPLLERLKFVAIFASNLDEFYMKRIAAIRRLIDIAPERPDVFGFRPAEVYRQSEETIARLRTRFSGVFDKIRRTELAPNGIRLKTFPELDDRERAFVQQQFETSIFPVVTPMAVDQGHPFPILSSRTLSLAVVVNDGKPRLAILPLPAVLPRLLTLPGTGKERSFLLLEEVIRHNLGAFFRGREVTESAAFRVMRDSELDLDPEAVADLLEAVEKEVRRRPKARAVSLEIEGKVSEALLRRLCARIGIEPERTKRIEGDLDLSYLFALVGKVQRPDLAYAPFTPAPFPRGDVFARIRERDFLVHLPFQSFQPVLDFIEQAARDPGVLAMKMTLYRTTADSPIVAALRRAAESGKQVTVLVELRARFDEERNINWARAMEESGCHVLYGIPGLKIHSKIALVVRKEAEGIRRYVHLSTGNYNESTARLYTDLGFFTQAEDIGRDASDVFNVLSGYSLPAHWRKVVSAPNDLKPFLFQLIDQEIENQKRSQNGFLFAKLNSLQDKPMIDKLYEAAQAGVTMKLLVRGLCCLVPGVPGLSETIEIRSLVGRFLEHSRIYCFQNNGNFRIFLSSADWMRRNLDRRIELLFPVERRELRQHLKWILETYWQDDVKTRVLRPDGTYARVPAGKERHNAQEFLIKYYAQRSR
jgi:polyphosphate kinase